MASENITPLSGSSPSPAAEPKRVFHSIQLLRALAALAVVVHHAKDFLAEPLPRFDALQAGVDVFFVISGFVMYASSRDEAPGAFLIKRLIRIAPLYILASLVQMLILKNHFSAELMRNFALSIAFVPHFSSENSGQILPVLVQGWTLNYEMFFYLVFAAALAWGRPLALSLVALGVLICLGFLTDFKAAPLVTYTSPLLLEFAFGLLLARLVGKLRWPAGFWLVPLAALLFWAGHDAFAPATDDFVGLKRVVFWGVPALLLVAGVLVLEQHVPWRGWAYFDGLGNASYAIYLFQTVAIIAAREILKRWPIGADAQGCGLIGLSLVIVVVLGMTIHALIERPLLGFLRQATRTHRLRSN